MARNFKELEAKMPPESRARVRERVKRAVAEMALDELRHARRLTQAGLASALGVDQGSISKLERRTDMYISTLRSYVEAMGGSLRIVAVFPDGEVEIGQFHDVEDGSGAV
jgi:DNA-binding XRE family transcriptional regulator